MGYKKIWRYYGNNIQTPKSCGQSQKVRPNTESSPQRVMSEVEKGLLGQSKLELILSTDSRDTNRQGTPLTILQITVSKKKRLIKRNRDRNGESVREKKIICIRVRLAEVVGRELVMGRCTWKNCVECITETQN